jgi:signal transduction histidine kinase
MMTSAAPPARPGAAPGPARRRVIDGVIAVVVIALQLAGWYAESTGPAGQYHPAGPVGYLLLAIGGAALLARRRYPAAVLAIAMATALGAEAAGQPIPWFVVVAAFVTAVLFRRRAAAIVSLITGYLASVWPPWLIGSPGHASAVFALALLAGLITLLSVAEVIRARNQRAVAIATRRQEQERRTASEERLAMARDLHDVVAHNISVINVQANTALHLMDRRPEVAREALTAIHEVSRQALGELRSVLGVLRADEAAVPLVPTPGLGRLAELAAQARTAGITVRLVEQGAPRPVPAGVDAAAYRIVQESLTNAVRHSGGGAATVRLRYDADALTIEVDDDGVTADPAGHGNGVAGMAERARALGGTLDAGPRPGGGFRVLARLPT